MADAALASLRSNATKLGQRLTENLAEHSRDLGLVDSFAPGSSGGSGKYLETASLTPNGVEETKKLLASKRESERNEGLKRVMAMMVKGLPVTQFFPLMTSLLSPTTPLQARSLVSMYIVHCAATAPEVALLSINAYQKDLSDPNPLVRATALTTLASMPLPDIRSLVGMAVSKGVRDTNWYVRRASGEAILALYRADPTRDNAEQLLEPIQVLLNTASPLTIASTIAAWEVMFPDKWDIIHRNYRKWCKMLIDTEEWGQCAIMRTLTRYARFHFSDPDQSETADKDASLLLRAAEPLLWHINPAVVLNAVRLVYYVGPRSQHPKLVQPLLRLLRHSEEIRQVVLANMALLAELEPTLLRPHLSYFFVNANSDSSKVRDAKLDILASLADESNIKRLLEELTTYVHDQEDEEFSARSIDALARCATRLPSVAGDCLRTMLGLVSSSNATIVTRAVSAIRALVKSIANHEQTRTITHLITLLYHGRIKDDSARADVYYLVGQYAQAIDSDLAHEMVRFGAKSFASESARAKEAICTMSAKILVRAEIDSSTNDDRVRTLATLFSYITALARYDTNYEIRDRARFLKGLIGSAQIGTKAEREAARLALAEEEFRKGVSLESYTGVSSSLQGAQDDYRKGDDDEEQEVMISAKQAFEILLEPAGQETGETIKTSHDRQLGTFGLLVPISGIAIDRLLPPYRPAKDLPNSSVRDVPLPTSMATAMNDQLSSSSFSSSSRSTTPTSFNAADASNTSNGKGSRGGKVVLVPTQSGVQPAPARRKADLASFYQDEESSDESEEGSSEEEEESEDEDEDEGSDDDDDDDESEKEEESEEEEEADEKR